MMLLSRHLVDAYLRRRYGRQIYDTPFDRFQVRIARTAEEHRQAFRLLHVAYAYQGIEPVGAVSMRITPQHVLPESTVLVAYEGEQIVGTQTVTLDSGAGLPLEGDYGEAIAALRAKDARIVEYGSLAVVRRCWHANVTTLLNMAAYWFATRYLRGTHCVVGVHPKIASFYRALYRFEPLGEARAHKELAAPVVGLVQDTRQVKPWFSRHYAGSSRASGLPMHLHFTDLLPSCVEMPPVEDLSELARWKLSRRVFRQLFIEESDRLGTLDAETRQQLSGWRTLETIGVGAEGANDAQPTSTRSNVLKSNVLKLPTRREAATQEGVAVDGRV